jgi:hypothetical protein
MFYLGYDFSMFSQQGLFVLLTTKNLFLVTIKILVWEAISEEFVSLYGKMAIIL